MSESFESALSAAKQRRDERERFSGGASGDHKIPTKCSRCGSVHDLGDTIGFTHTFGSQSEHSIDLCLACAEMLWVNMVVKNADAFASLILVDNHEKPWESAALSYAALGAPK